MDAWSRKHDSCVNCGTKRYPHKGKGYCNCCYNLSKTISNVEKWDYSKRSNLKACNLDVTRFSEERFNRIKNAYIKKLKDCLRHIKARENKLSEEIYGIDIEEQLTWLASIVRLKEPQRFWVANKIDHNFTPKQRKILFEMLKDLEYNRLRHVPSVQESFPIGNIQID